MAPGLIENRVPVSVKDVLLIKELLEFVKKRRLRLKVKSSFY